jgi:hypothetical protein
VGLAGVSGDELPLESVDACAGGLAGRWPAGDDGRGAVGA